MDSELVKWAENVLLQLLNFVENCSSHLQRGWAVHDDFSCLSE